MKRVSAILVAVILSTAEGSAAHELGARVDIPSKFERFVAPVGSVRLVQYYGIGHLDGQGGSVRFRVARISAAGQPSALLALEVRVSGAAPSRATHTGFIDADDLEPLMKALNEMDQMLKKRRALMSADMAEAEFSGGSVRVGTVFTNRPGDRDRFMIVATGPSRATATFDPSELPKVMTFVSKVMEKIAEVADGGAR